MKKPRKPRPARSAISREPALYLYTPAVIEEWRQEGWRRAVERAPDQPAVVLAGPKAWAVTVNGWEGLELLYPRNLEAYRQGYALGMRYARAVHGRLGAYL